MAELYEKVEPIEKPLAPEVQAEVKDCMNSCVEAIKCGYDQMEEYYRGRAQELGYDCDSDQGFQDACAEAREQWQAKEARHQKIQEELAAKKEKIRLDAERQRQEFAKWKAENMAPNYSGIGRSSDAWLREAGRTLAEHGDTSYYRYALKTAAEYKAKEDFKKMG